MNKLIACIAVIIGPFLMILAVMVTIFLRPDWLINAKLLQRGLKIVDHYGYAIHWGELNFKVEKTTFKSHHFAWDIRGLSMDAPSVPLHFSAGRFVGQFDLDWDLAAFPRIVHIGRLGGWSIDGAQLNAGPFAASNEPSTFDIDMIKIPWFLDRATFEPSTFSFDRLVVATSAGTLDGGGGGDQRDPISFTLSQNPQTVTLALNHSNQKSAPLCWRNTLAVVAPHAGQQNQSDLDGQCLQHISAMVALGLDHGLVRVKSIGPVKIRGNGMDLSMGSSTPPLPVIPYRPGHTESTPFQIPQTLANASLENVDVEVVRSSVKVLSVDGVWNFSGDLKASASASTASTVASLNHVKLGLTSPRFCLDIPYADGCFSDVNIGATLGKRNDEGALQLLSFQNIGLFANHLKVLIPESSNSGSGNGKSNTVSSDSEVGSDWQALTFENRNPRHYHVQIKRLEIISTKESKPLKVLASGTASLNLSTREKGLSQWRLNAKINPPATSASKRGSHKNSLTSQLTSIGIDILANTNINPLSGPYQGAVKASAALSSGEKIKIDLSALQKKNLKSFALAGKIAALNVQGVKDTEGAEISLKGMVDDDHADLNINGKISLNPRLARVALPNITQEKVCNQIPPPGPNLDLTEVGFNACRIDLNFEDEFPRAKLDLQCLLHLGAMLTSAEAETFDDARPMSVDLSTKLHLEGGEDARVGGVLAWRGEADVALLNHNIGENSDWLGLAAHTVATFVTSQRQPKTDLIWSTNAKLDLEVKKFQTLVAILKHQPYAIPAPFNILEGNSSFSVNVDGDSTKNLLSIPFSFMTALNSEGQKFNLSGDGQFHLADLNKNKLRTSLDTKFLFRDIALTLPHISLRDKFPMLFPDKRIKVETCEEDKTPADEVSLNYHVVFNSDEKKPILISTNLSKEVIPISLKDVVLDKNGMTGDVIVNEFNFEVFRRQADVKAFTLTLQTGDESPLIDGDIEFKYTDITINILIDGSTEEPVIAFESNPIRSEREIISILLFGQDATSFDDGQLQTADDLSAAFADQMIGLASLFMLAKTPIESVRYNPATKTFNAKVRLDERTSLNLGTTAEADQRVSVRHRLSSTWAIETDVSKDETTETTSGTALLEWSKRF